MPTRLQAGSLVQIRSVSGGGGEPAAFRISGSEKDRTWAVRTGGVADLPDFSMGDRIVVILEADDHNLFYDASVVEVRPPGEMAFRTIGLSKQVSKREYVRVSDFLCIECTVHRGEEKDVRDAFRKRANRKVPTRLATGSFFTQRDERSEFAEVEREILKVLVGIDTKIDAVVRFLGNGDRRALSIFTPRWVDLGGSGIRFIVSEPVSEGDFLEIRLQLPDFEGAPVPILGRVIRAVPSTRKDEPGSEVAVQYRLIEEEDRDRIIRYIFTRQRDAIRSSAERREEQKGVE